MEHPKIEFFTTHAKLEAGREQTVDVLDRKSTRLNSSHQI